MRRRRLFSLALALVAVLTLAGCASRVTYEDHKQSPVAENVGPDQYRIYAEGSRRNNRREVEAFGLTKAAETALENNHAYFKILESKFRSRTDKEPRYTFDLRIQTFAAIDIDADDQSYLEAKPIASMFGLYARSVK